MARNNEDLLNSIFKPFQACYNRYLGLVLELQFHLVLKQFLCYCLRWCLKRYFSPPKWSKMTRTKSSLSKSVTHSVEVNIITRIFKIVCHRPEVWMPDGEPVGVEAEGVAEGAQLAARGQRVEGEDGYVDADNSG